MPPHDARRLEADVSDGFVVYINGMRLNRLRALPQWFRAGRMMAAMLDRLAADPESGFLGYQPAFMGFRKGAAIQYWRSLADLKRFAQNREDLHVPAWTWYENEVDPSGGVGFWAELYVIGPDDYETFYRNLPPQGIGKFTSVVATPHDGPPERET